MNIYVLNHPTTTHFYSKFDQKNWQVQLVTINDVETFFSEKRMLVSPSFFILPFYYDQHEEWVEKIINYADEKMIPILFVAKKGKALTWTAPSPKHTVFDTIYQTITKKELIRKIRALSVMAIRLLSAKFKEEELQAMKKKMGEDLYLAKKVQQIVLPLPIKDPYVEINGIFEPSNQLSGDIYFWTEIGEGEYGLIIIDVSGHGIHSALISMSMRSLMAGLIKRVKDPCLIAQELNKHMIKLFQVSEKKKLMSPYFTAFIAYIDSNNRVLEYVNAGHPPGMLYQPTTKAFHLLKKGSLAIGLLPKLQIEKETISYLPGTQLLLYTDGLIEAPNTTNIVLLDEMKRGFYRAVERGYENLLESLLLSRMKHSEIMDDICIIHGILN